MENQKTIPEIIFNPLNLASMMELTKELAKNHNGYDTMLVGRNIDEETMELHILSDHIVIVTYQHNHWIRKNYYWTDGTVEEIFDGKWE